MTNPATTSGSQGFEAKLWQTADALRNNMDAAEYKHDTACHSDIARLNKLAPVTFCAMEESLPSSAHAVNNGKDSSAAPHWKGYRRRSMSV